MALGEGVNSLWDMALSTELLGSLFPHIHKAVMVVVVGNLGRGLSWCVKENGQYGDGGQEKGDIDQEYIFLFRRSHNVVWGEKGGG